MQQFLLDLDLWFISNTNRKVSIAVKMSYESKLSGKPFLRYENKPFFAKNQPFYLKY